MWLIVKWKEWNKRLELFDVFYSSVPETWVQEQNNEEAVLLWPMYSAQKDKREGNPIKGKTQNYACTILESGLTTFEAANMAEQRWWSQEQQHRGNVTTEFSELQDDGEGDGLKDYNKTAEELENLFVEQTIRDLTDEDLVGFDSNKAIKTVLVLESSSSQAIIENTEDGKEAEGDENQENTDVIAPLALARTVSSLTSSTICLTCSDTFEAVKKMEKELKSMMKDISDRIIENLEYTKLIQNSQSAKMGTMAIGRAKDIIEKKQISLPISSMAHLEEVNKLLKEDTVFADAMKSVLFQQTDKGKGLRKNFTSVWGALFDVIFLAKEFSMYGTETKKDFNAIFKHFKDLITYVLVQQHKDATTSEIHGEAINFFKHAGQSAKRKMEKINKNPPT